MTLPVTESTVEDATLAWLGELGYSVLHGPDIAPDEPAAERQRYDDVILTERLRSAVGRINPQLPGDAVEEVLRKVLRAETPSLVENNHRFHRLLVSGIDVQYAAKGRTVHDKAWIVDFEKLDNNDWLALNQFQTS